MSLTPTVTAFTNNETSKTALVSEYIRSKTPIGSTPVSTVTAIEYSTGGHVLVALTLTNFVVGALAGAGAALGLGNILYSFPTGDQHLETAYSLWGVSLTAAGTAVTGKIGLGSVIASGAVSVLNGTATFMDRMTEQAITTGSAGGAAVNVGPVGATAGIQTGIALNGTSAVKNVFLNAAGTWNANNTGNLLANGQVFISWTRFSS